MEAQKILVVGGGIGGLTAAIALRRYGHAVEVVERDPKWSVYGVGIIQQANVIRAMAELDLLDDYISAGVGFDAVEVFLPNGHCVARISSPRLVEGRPANLGIGRPALHRVLGDRTLASGATVRLGVVPVEIADDPDGVTVGFSDGTHGRYDLVVGADGVYSWTRSTIMPDAPRPEFTGQSVWRYNLPRTEGMDALQVFNGPAGVGLVPISDAMMYLFVTTAEPDNPVYPTEGLAARMREKLSGAAPAIRALAESIVDDSAVVYRPLEALLVDGPWHRGRVVLLGDSAHATTPHLGQGAGMAIEDSIVLSEELARHETLPAALSAYHDRRFERCAYIVRASLEICHGQIGRGPAIDNAAATHAMFERISQPI